MALLGYKKQFIEPLLSGQKNGTVRTVRKIPIKPGERLYHYTGLRTKHCQKIGESNCISVELIKIWINSNWIRLCRTSEDMDPYEIRQISELNEFAYHDGFANWDAMKGFWIESHGVRKNGRKVILFPFIGIHIRHTPIEEV